MPSMSGLGAKDRQRDRDNDDNRNRDSDEPLAKSAKQALHEGSDIDRLSVHASAVARRQEGGHVGNLVGFDQAARRIHFGQG